MLFEISNSSLAHLFIGSDVKKHSLMNQTNEQLKLRANEPMELVE